MPQWGKTLWTCSNVTNFKKGNQQVNDRHGASKGRGEVEHDIKGKSEFYIFI